MKRPLLIILSGIFLAMVMAAVALYVPTSLPAGSDFSAIYNTDLALVNGVPIYDLEAVEALAVKASGIPPEKFFLARFPYPPWYALSTFYLGLMPAQAAATLWFELNLADVVPLHLVPHRWLGRTFAVDRLPVRLVLSACVGSPSVGQYDFPVLLGTSMLMYSLRRENIPLTTLGAVLLTFKPHIGALVLLSALMMADRKPEQFPDGARCVLILMAGVLLFLVGFHCRSCTGSSVIRKCC